MKLFLKNNLAVLCTYLVIVCICCFFIASYDKRNIHLYLNQFVGHRIIDGFFFYITWLGDGTVAIFILAFLLIANVRLGIYATASFITAGLASFGLKRLFFDDVNRPFYVFNYYEHLQLKLVDGVDVHIHNSFPSGHATQAFAIFMCMAFVSDKRYVKFAFLALALLTSYSRVHLSQHWLADVTAGSVVGMFFSILFYYVFIHGSKFARLNKPVFVFIRYWRLR